MQNEQRISAPVEANDIGAFFGLSALRRQNEKHVECYVKFTAP
jgi:hypothetical protein